MTDVTVIGNADLAGKRLAFCLVDDRIGHYHEFRDFFIRIFGLDHKGLAEAGFVCAPSELSTRSSSSAAAANPSHLASRLTQSSMHLNRSITT
jgi:hypothetical protein